MLLPLCLLSRQCIVSLWIFISIAPLVYSSTFCCLRKPSGDSSDHFSRPPEVHFSAQNHVLRCLNIFQTLGQRVPHACGTVHLKSAIVFPKYTAPWGKNKEDFQSSLMFIQGPNWLCWKYIYIYWLLICFPFQSWYWNVAQSRATDDTAFLLWTSVF